MHGFYYDPLHGHCLRTVTRTSQNTYRIVGVYGDDEYPLTHGVWTATIRVEAIRGEEMDLRIDFSGKPIKTNRFMTAVYRQRCIHWDDGNVWRQLFVHGRQFPAIKR
jgi:hypothetical protein